MGKVLFGPAGNSVSFYDEGHKSTLEAPKWVKERGADLFEYSFGEGFRMSTDTAVKIGEEFKKEGVILSLHAPYFINFANPDDEMFQKSIGYINTGIKFMKNMQAERMVFHSGSCMKQTREDALSLMTRRFHEVMPQFEEALEGKFYICPETMGKMMQIGTYKEIIDLCTISNRLLPTFDFGHINALTQGTLKSSDDYKRIFDYSIEKLGKERTNIAHIHFSKIQYGPKGEIRHLTFEDNVYGPIFDHLAEVLVDYDLSCHVICESSGTMIEDSLIMKEIYNNLVANRS